MKSKYFLALFLTLPILFFCYLVKDINYELSHGKTVKVRMMGFAPRDILSGHYLYLRPDWDKTDCRQFDDNICPTELFSYNYRYYLPEFDARQVDTEISNNEKLKIEMLFIIKGRAKPLVKGLLIEGKELEDWLPSQS